MFYYTVKLNPSYKKITLEDVLSGEVPESLLITDNKTNTKTFRVDSYTARLEKRSIASNPMYYNTLKAYNEKYENLRQAPRRSLYREFYIPKKSGGLRKIDAPNDDLMGALRELKKIFEDVFGVLYHTSAFAYIKGRGIVDCIRRHQQNESRWFAKFDLHNFFGSTTPEFVLKQFQKIYPFSGFLKYDDCREEFMKAIDLAFLDGGLPQGTPISPLITNVMMIPIDFECTKLLRDFDGNRLIYTRYADDFQISCKYKFDYRLVEEKIKEILRDCDAPFEVNSKKTRFGSSSGRNWNLGIMLNKDNKMTVGYKNKKRLQAMLTSYVLDRRNGKPWEDGDIRALQGTISYYKMVEGDTIDGIVAHIGEKFGVDIPQLMKQDLYDLY